MIETILCPRCGEEHALEFIEFTRPVEGVSWALCDATTEPVLRHAPVEVEVGYGPVTIGESWLEEGLEMARNPPPVAKEFQE